MEQKKIREDIARNELKSLYLLFGEERFLVSHYSKAIEESVKKSYGLEFCKDVFEGAVSVGEIIMTAETLPFIGGKRLIFVKDSKLFQSGRKSDSELMAEYLPRIPEETIMVFIESEVDRRVRLFKQFSAHGRVEDCKPQTAGAIQKWVKRIANEKGKTMSDSTAYALINTCGHNMTSLFQEVQKLIHYTGQNKEINEIDIKAVATPTMESRIFELTKAMGAGRVSDALKLYGNMLYLKESPIMILTMIIRQLRLILLCKCAEEKKFTRAQMEKELGIRDFVVSEVLSHAARFSKKRLLSALFECQETDVKIKTGLIAPEIGVEILLIILASP